MATYTPKPEQKEALRALAQARRSGRRKALVVMASGIGKTVVSAFDVKKYLQDTGDTRAFLFLCHQNDILEQARETFQSVLGSKYEFGYFHGGRQDIEPVDGLFASFQSMRDGAEEFDPEEFGYIVVDESHHGHAPTYRPTLQYFQPDFMTGYTATPDRADLQDIRELYGTEVYSLPLEEALARGLLTKVDYRLMTDDLQLLDNLDTQVGKISVAELNRRLFVPKRDEEIVRIIAERSRAVRNPHTMIFCPSVEYCQRLSKMLPGAVAVHSGINPAEQDRRLAAFRRAEVSTVLTVDMFNEGIDIPEANVVVFLRSTNSRTIFQQQLGRGLRKTAGKRKVLVLDFVANCERLEMVHQLWHDVSEFITPNGNGAVGEYSPISVDIGKVEFTEVAQNVLHVLEAVRTGYTKELLIRQLRELAEKLGHTPSALDVLRASKDGRTASVSVFYNHFNGWNNALKAAGLPLNLRRYNEKEELINLLQELARNLGHTPSREELNQEQGYPTGIVYERHFGTWNKALAEAGLIARSRKDYTKQELAQQLRDLGQRIGRIPAPHDVNRSKDCASSATFKKHFGTFEKALEAAGFILPDSINNYSDTQLFKQLRKIATELGHIPSPKEINAAHAEGECFKYAAYHHRLGRFLTDRRKEVFGSKA